MSALMFSCPACGKKMAVGPNLAGRTVRCPHCRQVATAPASADPPVTAPPNPYADLLATAQQQKMESAESIFADGSEDGDSIIPSLAGKAEIPPAPPPTRPTPLVISGPLAGTQPRIEPPPRPNVLPFPEHAINPFADLTRQPGAATVPELDLPSPIAAAVADKPLRVESRPLTRTPWLLIAVTVYAILATGLAIWGWLR